VQKYEEFLERQWIFGNIVFSVFDRRTLFAEIFIRFLNLSILSIVNFWAFSRENPFYNNVCKYK